MNSYPENKYVKQLLSQHLPFIQTSIDRWFHKWILANIQNAGNPHITKKKKKSCLKLLKVDPKERDKLPTTTIKEVTGSYLKKNIWNGKYRCGHNWKIQSVSFSYSQLWSPSLTCELSFKGLQNNSWMLGEHQERHTWYCLDILLRLLYYTFLLEAEAKCGLTIVVR